MEIQQTYRMLKYQEALYKKELDIKKKELQEISTEKQNITIKKIHGELYYYAQQRKDGKVKSRYLSPVIPGKIADIRDHDHNCKWKFHAAHNQKFQGIIKHC